MIRKSVALLIASVVAIPVAAQSKPLLTPKDYGKWEVLGATRLSPRGDWTASAVSRVNEENELRLRGGPRDTTIVVANGLAGAFSANNRWAAYSIGVPPKERDRLTREKKPVHNSLEVRDLATGRTFSVSDIVGANFSPDGKFIAMSRYPAEGKKTSEVLVEDLANATRMSFANVGEQAWADGGSTLALAIDTEGGAGNAVEVYDPATGSIHVLESVAGSQYRGLAWRPRSTDLVVLRSLVEKGFKDTANALIAWNGIGGTEVTATRLNTELIPQGTRISDARRPVWSRDGHYVYFGVRKREPIDSVKKGAEKEKISDVEIWHPNDVRVIPQQKATEQQDLRGTLLTAWRMTNGKVVPIGTDLSEQSVALEGARYATETDRKPYAWGWKFGRDDQDVWVTDLATGERKRVLEKVRHYYGANPSGTKLAWSDGKDFWTVDIASGARTNLTSSLTAANNSSSSN